MNTDQNILQSLPDDIYIDRPKALEELIARLKRSYGIVLLGDSGSGKSMLIEKGLYPQLRSGNVPGLVSADSNDNQKNTIWRIATVRPGADPIGNLAAALAADGVLHAKGDSIVNLHKSIETKLRTEPDALRNIYAEAAADSPFNLLISVDQMHDIPRFNQVLEEAKLAPQALTHTKSDESDVVIFFSLLLDVENCNLPIYLILNCDTRYIGYFSRYQGLAEIMSEKRFTLGAISGDEIRDSLKEMLKNGNPDPDTNAFIDTLVIDYNKLLVGADPYALQKYNLARVRTLVEWKTNPTIKLLDIYQKIGGAQHCINVIADEIFGKMSADEQKKCSYIFKALTYKRDYDQYTSRPMPMNALIRCSTRQDSGKILQEDVVKIVGRFNLGGESFINIVYPSSNCPQTIVDINFESLLSSWEKLGRWIETENTHAQVYRDLAKGAYAFYAAHPPQSKVLDLSAKQPGISASMKLSFSSAWSELIGLYKNNLVADSDANSSGFYENAQLVSALSWESECQATKEWSLRYPVDLNPDDQKAVEERFSPKPGPFEVALRFLQDSKSANDARLEAKHQELIKALRQKWIARALVLFAVLCCAATVWQWLKVIEQKRNISMIEYVQLLDEVDVLDIPTKTKHETMLNIIEKIRNQSSINTNEEVLDLLLHEKILKIDTMQDTMKTISYKALLNLDKFHKNVEDGSAISRLKQVERHTEPGVELDSIHAQYERFRASRGNPFWQTPALFNTIYNYVDELDSNPVFNPTVRQEVNSLIPSNTINTMINAGCVIGDPTDPKHYLFGDKFGRIWSQKVGIGEPEKIIELRSPITCMVRNRSGTGINVGTESGKAYRFAVTDFYASQDAAEPTPFFTSATGRSIRFIGETDAADPVLIVSGNDLMYVNKGASTPQTTPIPLKIVASTAWSNDQNWLLATGFGNSILYKLDPHNKDISKQIEQKAQFLLGGRTVISAAMMKYEPQSNDYWVAFGTIGGRGILRKIDVSQLSDYQVDSINLKSDNQASWSLEAPVSGLAFNPGLPQLASSSEEGKVVLLNLNHLANDNDIIKMRNPVQGVSAITFLDKDNLVVYQNSTAWVMKTNIEALWERLQCLYNGCKE